MILSAINHFFLMNEVLFTGDPGCYTTVEKYEARIARAKGAEEDEVGMSTVAVRGPAVAVAQATAHKCESCSIE